MIYRIKHTLPVRSMKTGEWSSYDIYLEIDTQAVAQKLARSAARNKSKQSKLCSGAIVARAKPAKVPANV